MGANANNENGFKLNLYKGLFWDWRYDDIDWQKSSVSIIERVLERGIFDEWEEIIRFYGKDKILTALTKEIKYLPDFILDKVCSYFGITAIELACYERKLTRKDAGYNKKLLLCNMISTNFYR
ncbi:DUF6922 domain-containing protein [Paraflavitalea soli]|uniref:DUF6922 domain-containing protein n=1 Tax=Paraflavitalea soli TaxID=2315862 RepID=UPI001B881A21|nr:hypothetical protein [Paraflavitalea soli]